MSKPPFANLYSCKHVAERAAKACVVCYKPTSTVLITLNQKDWFYVCDNHLKDKQFADLVYRDASGTDTSNKRLTLSKTITDFKTQLEKHERIKAEKSQNGWFDKMGIWKSKENDKSKDDNQPEEDKLIPELKKSLADAESDLIGFEKLNVKYKLDPIFYKRRLMEDYQKQRQRETLKKMDEGTLFPSVAPLEDLK